MKIVTHNGSFHADDVFAVAALLLLYPEAEVVRSRDPEVIKEADIVVDVGQEYDLQSLRFDHHQPGGAGRRENGIPYAAVGLVWKEFGEKIVGDSEAAKIVEEKLIMPIDAIDNGFKLNTPVIVGVNEYSLGDYLHSFVGKANTLPEFDEVFNQVVQVAREILEREIESAKGKMADWREAKQIYDESKDKRIIILPRHMSWKRVLIPTEAMYVITERTDGSWQARAVPSELDSFDPKKRFPESWAGLKDDELADVSGVSDAKFCHSDRFLAIALSKEGAVKLAEIALNA